VKPCLVKLALISSCALTATHVFAQSAAQPRNAAATTVAKTSATPASTATITAAGSVLVLADGIVANAVAAQIQPPAQGFVYER
jgi:hypothetical protein